MKINGNRFLVLVLGWVLMISSALAVSPITSIQAHFDETDDPSNNFTANGAGTGAFPAGTVYNTTFTDGQFDNLIIDAFDVGTNNFIFRQLAQLIRIIRVDNGSITGQHHILLYDQEGPIQSTTNILLSSQYVGTMEEILLADVINRGVDNVFCNTGNGDGNNNNIERIDYIFGDGYPAFGNLRKKGFMVMDRGGNDALWIAAILGLDSNNNPTAYSQPVFLATTNWGNSGITLDTIVYRGYNEDFHPSADVSAQPLTGQYIEWTEFGIATNTLVYGYSLVAADVPSTQNWLNAAAFPLTTTEGSSSGGLDLMSGGALVLDEKQNATLGDRVWNDLNQNGLQDNDEPGLSNVLVRLYDSTGTNLAGQARTDENGTYFIYAIETGTYQLEVVPPTNYLITTADVGPDDTIDSDANTNTGRSGFVYLPPAETNSTLDAGMFLPPTDLGLSKTVNTNSPHVGSNVVYTISLTNFGPYAADNVEISDLLPVGLNYSNATATLGSYNPTSGIWSVGTLTNGGRASLIITTRVDLASGGFVLTNTAFVGYQDRPDTNTANNTASVVVVVQSVDLGVSKTVSTNLIGVTNLLTYRVTITNFGVNVASGVTLTDVFPAGLIFSNANASQGTYSTNTSLWTIGTLNVGASASLTITARVSATSAGLIITNTATANVTGQGDTNAANDSASVIITVLGADLGVTKTPDNVGPYPGSNVVYTILLTNSGPTVANGVSVTERLTNGLTYVSHVASSGTYNNVSGVWTVGAMQAGTWATLAITATVGTNRINTLITNITSITTTDASDGNTGNNSATAVVAVSSLRISKSSSAGGSVYPGSNIVYTIIVTNAGSLVHTNVTVTDPQPDGSTYTTNSTRVIGPILATNTVLDRFETAAFTNQNGTTNWAANWVEIGEADGAAASDVAIVSDGTNRVLQLQDNDNGGEGVSRRVNLGGLNNAGLSFYYRRVGLDASTDYVAVYASSNGGTSYVELDRFVGPNNDASYVFTNYDISAYASTNTTIRLLTSSTMGGTDIVYFNDVMVSWTVGGTNNVAGGAPPNLTSGWTLQGGQFLTITYTTRVDNPVSVTSVVNTAYATSLSQILPISASVTDTVAATDLAITKSVNNANPASGSNVIYTIVITNRGPLTATSVAVTEPLAAGLIFVTNTATRGSYTTNTSVWTIGTLTNNTAATLTITARVATNSIYIGSSITNTASISGSSLAELVTSNNTASTIITVGAADLAVTKTASDLTPLLGDTVTFTIALTNNGPSTASSILLYDLLPPGYGHVSSTPSQGAYAPASGIWTVGTMTAGSTASLTINAAVTTSVIGLISTNRAYFTNSSQPDPVTANNTSAVVLVTGSSTPLGIGKVSGANGSAPPGYTNLYTITITNSTTFTHTGVRVVDPIPSGMTYVASSTLVTAPYLLERFWVDNFSSRNYAANHGNTNFISAWDESEAGDDPLAGNIQITYDALRGETYSLQFQGSSTANQYIRRNADLSTFTNGILSFEYRRDSLEAGDFVLAQISSNGFTGPWTTLLRMEGPASDTEYFATNFNIISYISTNVAVRFITTNTALGAGDYVWIDDLRIDSARKEYLTRSGELPPLATTNITLYAGDYMVITLRAIVDSPSFVTQVVNTASVTTEQQLITLYASVTDRVEFADLGVGKIVSDGIPDQGSTIIFTISLTNYGPFSATSVQIQDLLPAGLTYLGYSSSTGTYTSGSGLWSFSTLGISNVASLVITASVNSGTAGQTITNYASVLAANQGDRNTTNNLAEASIRVVPPFLITDCDIETTNGAVMVYHQTINSEQLYDLLYCDAISFHDGLSNQWQLADRRAGGLLSDTGAVSRTAPTNLPSGWLRFYRLSAPGFWQEGTRRAGVQVLAFGVANIYPGQNWVRPWGQACDNTLAEVLERHLPAGGTVLDATKVMWFARAPWPVPCTSEVFLASGTTPTWKTAWPTNREGEVADNQPLPLADGFVVEMPTNQAMRKLPMIFHVPTNAQVQVLPGSNRYTVASVNLPESLHPSQLNLLGSGFTGGINPVFSDWLWKYDRASQTAPDVIWYRTSDQTWRFTSPATYPLVPTNYFRPDDAIVIQTRKSAGNLTWTNRFHYSVPTREMMP